MLIRTKDQPDDIIRVTSLDIEMKIIHGTAASYLHVSELNAIFAYLLLSPLSLSLSLSLSRSSLHIACPSLTARSMPVPLHPLIPLAPPLGLSWRRSCSRSHATAAPPPEVSVRIRVCFLQGCKSAEKPVGGHLHSGWSAGITSP